MEDIAPSLKLCIELRLGLERGEHLRPLLRRYLQQVQDEFSKNVAQQLYLLEQGKSSVSVINSQSSLYRRSLLQLIEQAHQGRPVLKPLQGLELEIDRACEIEMQKQLSLLPLKLLLPLLFLQFPAFLILLLGPLFRELLAQL